MSDMGRDGDDGADPELASWAGELGDPPVDADAMFRDVQGQIATADHRPLWWLRSRPTAVRRTIAILSVTALVAFTALADHRPDMGVYPIARMVASLVAMGILLLLSVHQALRPMYEPALGFRGTWLLAGLALVATLVVTALPAAHGAHPASLGGTGEALLPRAAPCFYFGLLVGLPIYATCRLLDRGSELSPILAACAAGLTGNVLLQLECPLVAPEHNVLAHFGVAVTFIAAVASIGALARRRRVRSS